MPRDALSQTVSPKLADRRLLAIHGYFSQTVSPVCDGRLHAFDFSGHSERKLVISITYCGWLGNLDLNQD